MRRRDYGQDYSATKKNVPCLPSQTLKNTPWLFVNSFRGTESSLLAEELQHDSAPLPFEKGNIRCSSRRQIDQHADRQAEWEHVKARADDFFQLATCMSFILQHRTITISPFKFCPQDNVGLVRFMQFVSISLGKVDETIKSLGK